MPLRSIPGNKALSNLRRNPLARWPDGRRDGRRLEGIVLPVAKPGFRMREHDMVFTIGSCFARNIEARLHELGFRLPTLAVELPEEERGSDTVNDILNKYNPHSITNELRWAFEGDFPEDGYLKVANNQWHDPHLSGSVRHAPLSRLRGRRAMVTRLFRRLPRCRYVVVTLGLVEAWHDATLDLYLNGAPPVEAVAREPQRFRLDVLDHDDIVAELERMWALMRAHGHPKVRMLLTVSPVPLRATFTDQDVLVANMYSKSVLRAAVGTFVARHDEVDYFPSYEAAMMTTRATAFMEDNRHVAPELVNAIMDRVVGSYVRGAPEPADPVEEPTERNRAISVQVRDHIKMRRPAAARRLLAQVAKTGDYAKAGYTEFTFRYTYAKCLADLGAFLEAEPELQRCVELEPDSGLAWYPLGRVLGRLQRPLRAEEAFRRAVTLDPANAEARIRLGRLEARNGKLPDAERTILDALALVPDSNEAADALADIRAAAATEWGGEDDGAGDGEGAQRVDRSTARTAASRLRGRFAAILTGRKPTA